MEATDQHTQPHKLEGLCLSMCPTEERILRIREKLFHLFECKISTTGERSSFPDSFKFVKEYNRSAADQSISPQSVRPLPVLKKTVRYLLSEVINSSDVSWREIYNFVSDRLRAVFKDICVQDVFEKEALEVLVPMARFFIFAHYKLCDQSISEFDPYLNLKQLNQTLVNILLILKKFNYFSVIRNSSPILETSCFNNCSPLTPKFTLFKHYSTEHEGNDSFCGGVCSRLENLSLSDSEDDESSDENENLKKASYSIVEEMVSMYLLVNLGNEESVHMAHELPQDIRNLPLISDTVNSSIWWLMGNYYPLCRQIDSLPPLLNCAVHLHINKLQRHALEVLSVAHNNKAITYNLKELQKNLLYDSSESMVKACLHYGLSVNEGEICFIKDDFKKDAPLLSPTKADWLNEKMSSKPLTDHFLEDFVCRVPKLTH